ncbi:Flagellar protein [gamma proteobacterium HdN1]|nr:Flagellar protein [gamma proteobacterium HdN1]
MKKKSERLIPVRNLRDRELKDEARKLADASKELQSANKQLNDLHQYLQGYYADTANGNLTFRNGRDLQGYQQFVTKLMEAIARQQEMAELKDAAYRNQQKRWVEANAALQAMDRLIEKARQEEQKKEDKRDQKLVDELSTRLYLSRSNDDT